MVDCGHRTFTLEAMMADQGPTSFVLFVTENEGILWDQLSHKRWMGISNLNENYRKKILLLAKAGLLERNKTDEFRKCGPTPLVLPIVTRRPYWLPPERYNLVRALQASFRPDPEEDKASTGYRLKEFIEAWTKQQKVSPRNLRPGAWLRCARIAEAPSQGSGIILNHEDQAFISAEGFEAFELFDESKNKRRKLVAEAGAKPEPEESLYRLDSELITKLNAALEKKEILPHKPVEKTAKPEAEIPPPIVPINEALPAPDPQASRLKAHASRGSLHLQAVIDELAKQRNAAEAEVKRIDAEIRTLQHSQKRLDAVES